MQLKLKIVKDDIFTYATIPDETVLCEDMYQVTYEQYAIDCGWYESVEGGRFIAYLIRDNNWDVPVIKIQTTSFEDAKWSIKICIEYLGKH